MAKKYIRPTGVEGDILIEQQLSNRKKNNNKEFQKTLKELQKNTNLYLSEVDENEKETETNEKLKAKKGNKRKNQENNNKQIEENNLKKRQGKNARKKER